MLIFYREFFILCMYLFTYVYRKASIIVWREEAQNIPLDYALK